MSRETGSRGVEGAAPAPGVERDESVIRAPLLRLAIAGASGLFLELALIRWSSAQVLYLSYVSNFVLISAFFGLGLGALLAAELAQRTRDRMVVAAPALLAAVLVGVALFETQVVVSGAELLYFQNENLGTRVSSWLVLALLGVLFVALFCSIGVAIGRDLGRSAPLRAYSAEIGGSLFGIALFTLLALLGASPVLWFSLGGLGLLLLGARGRRAVYLNAIILLVAVFTCAWVDDGALWSPYYRVRVLPGSPAPARHPRDPAAGSPRHRLQVNSITHQHISDIRLREPFYEFPYRALGALPLERHDLRYLVDPTPGADPKHVPRSRLPLERVLVVGAGNGTDTAFALAYGAKHVDAVEIDPLLAQIGRELQPNRPYQDPRVKLWVGDARTFLEKARGPYDLVVFGLPDSLTLASPYAGLRLESFLFTRETFARIRALLQPNHGLFVGYNYYREPWLVDRIARTIEAGFERAPKVLIGPDRNLSAAFFAGPGLSNVPPRLGDSWGFRWRGARAQHDATVPSDDWPFLYARRRAIPPHLVGSAAVMSGVALLTVLAVLFLPARRRARREPVELRELLPFFLMGVSFLLLETAGLVRMSLLFGSTWLVNALVFFAVLLMVLLANGVAAKLPLARPWRPFLLLFAALLLAWWLPPSALSGLPSALRYGTAASVLFVPILLANLVFSRAFKRTSRPAHAFGANLVGAVVGGCLENLSLVLGYRALFIVALGLYTLALVATTTSERRRA